MKSLKLLVSVTADDIQNGVPNSAYNCPIARAIRRQCPDWNSVTVSGSGCMISYTQDDEQMVFDAPSSVREFIFAFDDGKAVEPFEFEAIFEERWD